MSQPRIPPRPVGEWTNEVDDAFSALRAHGPVARPRSNILGIYAWHPALVRAWLPFSDHLRHSTLSDRIREMAIIRTTWLGFGEYEWAQHVRMSRAAATSPTPRSTRSLKAPLPGGPPATPRSSGRSTSCAP